MAARFPQRDLPPELDREVYRAVHPDLAGLDDEELEGHYLQHGREEGRTASPAQSRSWFVSHLAHLDCLEIGPFDCPVLSGPKVRYFDILDQAGLARRAADLGRPHGRPPRIDFVSPTGDLAVIPDAVFDAVLSCHVVEHQPDLIRHFRDVARILRPGGIYVAIIPDKRYCFDHFIGESTIADAVARHVAAARTHRLESVIEHRALTCHNDSVRHWAGDHGEPPACLDAIRRALAEYEAAAGGYVDVHAWQFHPLQFRMLTGQLFALGYAPLRPVRVYGTLRDQLEFIAVLERAEPAP